MEIKRCMSCMEELAENEARCPACGADKRAIEQPNYALQCGAMLHGRYLVGKVLGQGGFGITYIGLDLLFNVKVAVKEYFPMGMVTRDSGGSSKILWNTSQASQTQRQGGYDSFLKEARKMAKIARIPSIVRVLDIFLDNETAYIVMDYVEGITLKQKLSKDGPMSFSDCISLLRPLMEDLAKVHREGMIHRDISPDNIMIQPDGSVRLLDLGAAKDMTAVQGVSSQVVAKKGFSPFEQYKNKGEVGPWTDVYAICATIYYCITGKLLPDAFDRVEEDEEIHFPDSLKEPLSEKNKEALRAGLEVRAKKRTQSVEELLQQFGAGEQMVGVVEGTRQEEEKEVIANSGQNEKVGQVSAGKESSQAKMPKIKKGAWDVSRKQDGTVMAWVSPTGNGMYELYIGGKGGVQAPQSCENLFKGYTDVEKINFNGSFDTSQVTDMGSMFYRCGNLSQLDLSSFDTGQVTDMRSMFGGCSSLRELDLSSFDMSKVTDDEYMFENCSAKVTGL